MDVKPPPNSPGEEQKSKNGKQKINKTSQSLRLRGG